MPHSMFRSFQHSLDGIRVAWRDDHSFRNSALQFVTALLLASLLYSFSVIGVISWLVLIGASMPVLVVETINTSIEAVVDKASPERSKLAKKAKDIGSAAVLLTRVYALICWAVILYGALHPAPPTV